MGRLPKEPLRTLTAAEIGELDRISRARRVSVEVVIRAKILLAVAQGKTYTQAAQTVGRTSITMVVMLVKRFNQEGLEALLPRQKKGFKARLQELQKQKEGIGTFLTVNEHTVNDLLDDWLANASNLKPATIAQYRWFLDTYVRPTLGPLYVEQVTPNHLQPLYVTLTPAMGEKVYRLLHRAFAVAVLWQWITTNPCDRVLKPSYKTPPKLLWSRVELDSFLKNTTAHWLYPLWVLLMATGCRLGEGLALCWTDIDSKGVLKVYRTLHRIGNEWSLDSPKTTNSARSILLPDVALDALQRQSQQQETWKTIAGDTWTDWGLVFTGKTGMPLFASSVQHAMKRECNALGLEALTPHGFRHLHASLLLAKGVPITTVSSRLGHANPQITLKIYAHAFAEQDQLAADAIEDVLSKGVSST